MKKVTGRWIVSLFLIFLFFICCIPVKGQEQGQIAISLKYGFENNVKSGSSFPLQVTLQNTGEAFEGSLEMEIPIQAENQDVASSIWMGEKIMGQVIRTEFIPIRKNLRWMRGKSGKKRFICSFPCLRETVLCG